jgi:chromate transporter
MSRLLDIAMVFGGASLLSFGGGNAIIPQLQMQTVEQFHWLSDRQFADSFAITQVTPGPSTLLVTLLGYRAEDLPGALVATIAMIVPAAILMGVVAHLWLRTGQARWHAALERGIAPIAVGLVAASGMILAHAVDRGPIAWAITIAAGLLLGMTKLNPLIIVSAGGLIGLVAFAG